MKFLSCILVSCIFMSLIVSNVEAAPKYNGSYTGTLLYKRASSVNGGVCSTKAQYPSWSLSITGVLQQGSKVKGTLNSAQGPVAMSGATNNKGFKLNFKYNDPYYGYVYNYKITFTSVKAKSASVTYDGTSLYGGSGCHYTYSGKVVRGK